MVIKPKFEAEVEEYLSFKSKPTREAYATGFRLFLEYYQGKYGQTHNFNDFLNNIFEEFKKPLRERKRVSKTELKEYIEFLKQKGNSNNSVRVYFAAMQNFLKFKQIMVSMDFIGNMPSPVGQKINEKHEWHIEQIKEFVDKSPSYREKALILCIFQSGLGINEIIELNYGDVQEELEKGTLPLYLKLVRKKTQIKFKTFFGTDAVYYLRLYLATRKDLNPESPLFVKERLRGGEERITDCAVQQSFSEMAKDLSFIKQNGGFNPERPHPFRAAFNSRLMGKIDQELRQFWMGHSIGAQNLAYLNMPTDDWRASYLSAEEFLKIEKSSKEEMSGKTANTEDSKKLTELQNRFEVKERIIDALVKDVMEKSLELEAFKEELLDLRTVVTPLIGIAERQLRVYSRSRDLHAETAPKLQAIISPLAKQARELTILKAEADKLQKS